MMSNSEKKIRGRPRSRQSHAAILQATLALLAEVGFDAMSIEAIAQRAGVGKTTIYRRYTSKEELVADAIEQAREEIFLPDTGSFRTDIEAIIQNAAQITLSPIGRQTVAMIVSSASRNAQFALIYQTKYLQPRRAEFSIVVERAKARGEVPLDTDADWLFDTMSGIMLFAMLFQPTPEGWIAYVQNALDRLLEVQ